MNEGYDWLGICLEMMRGYFPVETSLTYDSEKYWGITAQLLSMWRHLEPNRVQNCDADSKRRNDLVTDLIQQFSASNRRLSETGILGDEQENTADNIALTNLLLLSVIS